MTKTKHKLTAAVIAVAAGLAAGCSDDRGAGGHSAASATAGHAKADQRTVEEICGRTGLYGQVKTMVEGRQNGVSQELKDRFPGGVWSYDDPAVNADWLSVWVNGNFWADTLDERLAQPDAPDTLKPVLHAYTRAIRQALAAYYEKKSGDDINKAADEYKKIADKGCVESDDPDPGPAASTACDAFKQTATVAGGIFNGLIAAHPAWNWADPIVKGDVALATTSVDYMLGKLQRRRSTVAPLLADSLGEFSDATYTWARVYDNQANKQVIDATAQTWAEARDQSSADTTFAFSASACGPEVPDYEQAKPAPINNPTLAALAACDTYRTGSKQIDAMGPWFDAKTGPGSTYDSRENKTFGWETASILVGELWSKRIELDLLSNTGKTVNDTLGKVVTTTRDLDIQLGLQLASAQTAAKTANSQASVADSVCSAYSDNTNKYRK